MRTGIIVSVAVLFLAVVSMTLFAVRGEQLTTANDQAPEFKDVGEWINSKPLQMKDLKGKVVIVHFWTFGCINCMRNYPSYTRWHEDYEKKGAVVIGVHTPESNDERKVDRVRQKIKDNKMTYPIAVDNAGKTWEAWHNESWPSIYLIDKKGRVRYRWVGELNWGETKGEPILRKKIEELLAEKE